MPWLFRKQFLGSPREVFKSDVLALQKAMLEFKKSKVKALKTSQEEPCLGSQEEPWLGSEEEPCPGSQEGQC